MSDLVISIILLQEMIRPSASMEPFSVITVKKTFKNIESDLKENISKFSIETLEVNLSNQLKMINLLNI